MNIGILTACLLILVQSSSPEPEKAWLRWADFTPRDGAEEQAATNDQQRDSQAVSSPSADKQHQESTRNERNETKSKPSDVWKKAFSPETWSQWALFVIGVAGVIAAIVSLRMLGKQVGADIVSADAAKQSAEVAKQSLHTLERARIAIEGLKFIISKDRQTFKYSFVMVNTGSTPGHVFEMNYSYLSANYENDDFLEKIGEHRYSGGPAVKENFTMQAHQRITTTTKDAMPFLPDEQPVLYAVGYIKYRDIFDVEQRTNFAFEYCGESIPPGLVTKPGYNTAT